MEGGVSPSMLLAWGGVIALLLVILGALSAWRSAKREARKQDSNWERRNGGWKTGD